MYITPSLTSGCVSWPRCFSPPSDMAQAGTRLATLSLLTDLERAVALALRAEAVRHDVVRRGGVVVDVVDGHVRAQWTAETDAERNNARAGQPLAGLHFGHPLVTFRGRFLFAARRKNCTRRKSHRPRRYLRVATGIIGKWSIRLKSRRALCAS